MNDQSSTTAPADWQRPPLVWHQLSMTVRAFGVLKAYRRQLSCETGGPISMGQAVDALILSHPVADEPAASRGTPR